MSTLSSKEPSKAMLKDAPKDAPKGLVLHTPLRYDITVWLFTRGREKALREEVVRLAGLVEGERVLDVGCGTGSLSIAAKRRVGASGAVHGVDASPEMLDRAKRKARKAGLDVDFRLGPAQSLLFSDGSFDAVLSMVMLHHLPKPARKECAREMRRVLAPGGRVLAVDFTPSGSRRRGLLGHLHTHGGLELTEMTSLLTEAGLQVARSGPVGRLDLQFVLATAP